MLLDYYTQDNGVCIWTSLTLNLFNLLNRFRWLIILYFNLIFKKKSTESDSKLVNLNIIIKVSFVKEIFTYFVLYNISNRKTTK